VLAVVLLRDAPDDVALPPVIETRLERAAASARCELRGARAANPPVAGPARGAPAAPGVYDEPLPVPRLIGALRAGTIVIQYRSDLPDALRDDLERVQAALPRGTVVAPSATRMRYAVAVTAWQRLLGCPRFGRRSIDAVRLFRGRFVGSGPDAP